MNNQPNPYKIRDLARQVLRQSLVKKIPGMRATAAYYRVVGRQDEYESLVSKLAYFREIDGKLLLILNNDFDAKYCAYPSKAERPRTPSPLSQCESPSSSRSSSPPDLDGDFAAASNPIGLPAPVATPAAEGNSGEPQQKRPRNS